MTGRGRGRIQALDDGCLMRIFSFLTPLPGHHPFLTSLQLAKARIRKFTLMGRERERDDKESKVKWGGGGARETAKKNRFNTAAVCRRWYGLASDHRLWLRVDCINNAVLQPDVFATVEAAVTAARPGDTISISSGVAHMVSNISINKPLCLRGEGLLPEDTILLSQQGSDSALEFTANGKVSNLSIKTELGSCLLHRKGRLTIQSCYLCCAKHPLEHLSCAIVSTTGGGSFGTFPCSSQERSGAGGVSVIETRIEGGSGAVQTDESLSLQGVRVIYGRAALTFWFNLSHTQQQLADSESSILTCHA